jgi:hypothetical protein
MLPPILPSHLLPMLCDACLPTQVGVVPQVKLGLSPGPAGCSQFALPGLWASAGLGLVSRRVSASTATNVSARIFQTSGAVRVVSPPVGCEYKVPPMRVVEVCR